MLRTLLKKQLSEIFRAYFVDQKKGAARNRGATIAFFVLFALLMVGVLGGIFTSMALNLLPLAEVGLGWMYFAVMGLIGLVLGLFGSVFNTYAGLYLAKDNDLLLSLPIPPRTVMNARLLGVYLMALLYSAVVTVPMAAVWLIRVDNSPAALLCGLLMILVVSLLTTVLSALLGYVVARVSLRLKNKSFLTVLLALLFLAAYYFFYFKASSLLQSLLLNAETIGERVRGDALPLFLFGQAGTGDWSAMLPLLAVTLVLSALVWWLLSRSFLKIVTSTGKTERMIYREKAVKVHSPASALLRRELRHFFSNSGYMLNCGMGCVFQAAAGVALLWKGNVVAGALDRVFGGGGGTAAALLCGACCMISAIDVPAAPSLSLEGKSLGLLRALPVGDWELLRAKVRFQLAVSLPTALFCALCLDIALAPDLLTALFVLTTTVAFCLFCAAFAAVMGLVKANFTWTRELVPIKQGIAVLLAMLGGAVAGFLLLGGALLFTANGAALYLAAATVVLLALSLLLLRWLKLRGPRRMASL